MDPTPHRPPWRASAAFAVLGIVCLDAMARVVLATPLTEILVNPEVYRSQRRARLSPQKTTLVLGDSVARQLYNQNNEEATGFLHLTTNQAVSMVGQYLLLREALEHHARVERVVLVIRPHSFRNDLAQGYTFNSFVKPFCTFSNWAELSDSVRERLRRHPAFWLGLLPLVKATRIGSEVDYSVYSADPDLTAQPSLSPVSVEYLKKIAEVAKARGIRLELRGVPIKDVPATDLEPLKKDVADNGLSEVFAGYFESITVMPEARFFDKAHLKPDEVDKLGPNPLGL
jgi:hypothetical protein